MYDGTPADGPPAATRAPKQELKSGGAAEARRSKPDGIGPARVGRAVLTTVSPPLETFPSVSGDETEISIIGGMLISSGAADLAFERLDDDHFAHDEHREIFLAIRALRGQDLTWIEEDKFAFSVQAELKRSGCLEKAGGEEYLALITDRVPTAANIRHHIKCLLEDAEAAGRRPWPALEKLPPEWPAAPTLPEDLLPAPFRSWCPDIADRMQVPLEMVAVPALVELAAVVGSNATIRPKRHDDWRVVPNLWGAIVALPGRLKSPALAEALRPLKMLQREAFEDFERRKYSDAADLDALRAQEAAIKNLMRKCHESVKPVRFEGREVNVPALRVRLRDLKEEIGRFPSAVRYLTNDTTVEKLGELLRDSPRGLLVERDELAGWLRSIEREDRRGDREFYLEGWNGGSSYTSDRIVRGTVHAPSLTISIIGGIQPGKLKVYVAEALAGGSGADGLLQRFQVVVWPEDPRDWSPADRAPNRQAQQAAESVYRRLAESPSEVEPRRFSAEAQALFDAWRCDLERRLRSEELSAAPAFLAHLAKYRSLMPSLALLFHLVESEEAEVSAGAAQLAAAWCEFLEAHARKVYAPELNGGVLAASALAAKIQQGKVEDGWELREIYRKGWSSLRNAEEVHAALKILSGCRWARVKKQATGGRPREVIRINPRVFEEAKP